MDRSFVAAVVADTADHENGIVVLIRASQPATVSITATDATAGETARAKRANPGVFQVKRTGSTASALTVSYSIAGTAKNGKDYAKLTGTVTIPAGKAAALIHVSPTDDALAESAETVKATLLSSPEYSFTTKSTATVRILDNDTKASRATTAPTAAEGNSASRPSARRSSFASMRRLPRRPLYRRTPGR